MATWMYQLNQQNWPPSRYRLEIWEGERWVWPVGQRSVGGKSLNSGDTIVFFYAPSGGNDPGFYGWAVVLEWLEDNSHLYFRAVAPSDHLKMHPWWDKNAQQLADKIRGKMKQRTLWLVPDELINELRNGITSWIGKEKV
jgi:hypothetical protein